MNKDLNMFGGLLKFFYILFWFIFVLSLAAALTAFYVNLVPNKVVIDSLHPKLDLSVSSLSLLVMAYILLIFKRAEPKTVLKLTLAFSIVIFINVVYALVSFYLYKEPLPKLMSFALPVIFLSYMHSSKRAATYYKQTKKLKKIIKTEQESIVIAHGFAIKGLISMVFIALILLIIYLFLPF